MKQGIHFNEIRQFGAASLMLSYFRKYYWLHPCLIKGKDFLSNGILSLINTATAENLISRCEINGWYYPKAHFLFYARGKVLRQYQINRLKQGPDAHTRMIYRISALFEALPKDKFHIEIDEGITEQSLPTSWGAISKAVPDIIISPLNFNTPKIWIECERTIKTAKAYSKKLSKISKDHLVLYIAKDSAIKHRLIKRFPKIDGKRSRITVLEESESYSYLKTIVKKLNSLNQHEQLHLF